MEKIVKINKQEIVIREYNGQRVVTFKDIDTVHGRPEGTAGRNIRKNKAHFIEGADFFKISPDEFRRAFGAMDKRQQNDVTLITESGYLMLAKSFTDELAWAVQRELVNSYFRVKEKKPERCEQLRIETAEYHYFEKTWRGQPVLSTEDAAQLTGVTSSNICWHLRRGNFVPGIDYFDISRAEMREYKAENPNVSRIASRTIVVTKSGFVKLVGELHSDVKMPECFDNKPVCKSVQEPSESMKSLIVYLKKNTQYIDILASLLLMPDTRENHEIYRQALLSKMRELHCYKLDVETIII